MLFYSVMQNSSKTWQRRWQKVDKIKTISSKTMFEVSSLRTNTSSILLRHWSINSHVGSRLFKAAPNFNQPLLQFVDGVDFPPVYTTLHDSPDLVINRIEIWTVWRPQIWRKSGVSRRRTSTVYAHDVLVGPWTVTLVLVLQRNVATKLSYGGKFFILVMSHFFLIPTLKEFKKSTNIYQSYSKNKSGPVFWHSVFYLA